MAKFSRSDIRQFFRDTLTEAYGDIPYFGQTLNDGPPDAPEEVEELEPAEIRRRTRARRHANPPPPPNPARMPTDKEFAEIMALRQLRRGEVREMIEEAVLFSTRGSPRTEFYPDDHALFDPGFQEELEAHERRGDKVMFSPSGDAMDTPEIEFVPSDDLSGLEMPDDDLSLYNTYTDDAYDDVYPGIDDMTGLDTELDDASKEGSYYSDMEELVMERQQIRQMISDVLKQG